MPTDPVAPQLFAAQRLTEFVTVVLQKIGTRTDDARAMAQLIVAADLAGHESCGLRQLPGYVDAVRQGTVDPTGQPIIDQDHGAMLRVDGGAGFGQVTYRFVTDLVIERARQHGICAVGVHNSHHLGRIADFSEVAAAQGIITMFFLNQTGNGQAVAPHGGSAPRLATNPLAVGIPRGQSPHFVADLATSSVAKARLAQNRDQGLPDPCDWVTSGGVLRTFGGAKGFALSLVVDALAGGLTGAGTVGRPGPLDAQAALVIGIDAAAFRSLDDVTSDVDAAFEHVRSGTALAGAIRIPGESSAATTKRRVTHGVPVREYTREQLRRVADELQIEPL